MSASSQRTKHKLSLLQLAEELGNVSKACQLMGHHRDSFYEIKRRSGGGDSRFAVGSDRRLLRTATGAPDYWKPLLNNGSCLWM